MSGFHDRHAGLFAPADLESKRVLIVGAGSVGSQLAVSLARAGVKKFWLIDFDWVSETNLCRTAYREQDVGRFKVHALGDVLRSVRRDIQVGTDTRSLVGVDDDELAEWIRGADLVVGATDHPPTQGRLAALSYATRPALFSGVYAKGEGGEVLYTLPEVTPCYWCVLGSIRGEHAPDRGRLDYGLAPGQLAAEPALGVDILHVTVCAAKVALALLLRGTGTEVEKVIDPARSVLFVGNVASWIWREPFETVWARAERREQCVCRPLPDEGLEDDEALGLGAPAP